MNNSEEQKAEQFLKDYEESLIYVVGEEDWKRNKTYTVEEVISFMQSHANQTLQEMKERVEGMPAYKDGYADEGEFKKKVIETIEDMQDE